MTSSSLMMLSWSNSCRKVISRQVRWASVECWKASKIFLRATMRLLLRWMAFQTCPYAPLPIFLTSSYFSRMCGSTFSAIQIYQLESVTSGKVLIRRINQVCDGVASNSLSLLKWLQYSNPYSQGMSSSSSEGWQNEREISVESSPERVRPNTIALTSNNLLSEAYPIEPDMLLGWKPKLPLGPIPLSYTNFRSEYILATLKQNHSHPLVYLGSRPINSVKVNQQYQYTWKDRSRYQLNLRLLREAVEGVGRGEVRDRPRVRDADHLFDSDFEGGNLDFVVEAGPGEYDCFVRSDTNTKGHCNWFYFTVTNRRGAGRVRLNICNLIKKPNLYRKGMGPFTRREGAPWRQSEGDVTYTEKHCRFGYPAKDYQLEFEVDFEHPGQTVSIAYGIPYTYSRLEGYVKRIAAKFGELVSTATLCESLGGLPLPLLTITDEHNHDKKQVVLVCGRIHPGESVSSFVVEGFVEGLLQNPECRPLLRRYIFKVIPMMNPDGVVAGNFRTSYSGKDLNRQFHRLSRHVFPEAYYLDRLAKSLKKEYGNRLVYYFDFHGHSTKTNLFCYGPDHLRANSYYLKARAFAKLVEQKDAIFSYQKCLFSISESKKNTGRASMLRKARIPMSFTFEMSNGLYETGGHCSPLYQEQMYRGGYAILQGFHHYSYFIQEMKNTKLYRMRTRENKSKESQQLTSIAKLTYSSQILSKRRSSLAKKIPTNPTIKCILDRQQGGLEQIYSSIIREEAEAEDGNENIKEVEGGSDSEGESEDLDEVESDQLFDRICRRDIQEGKRQNILKIKRIKHSFKNNSTKSDKLQKLESKEAKCNKDVKEQRELPAKESKEVLKRANTIVRSLTARIRRPTIPLPVAVTHQSSQQPIQKQVLIQKHFVLNL